MHVTPRRTPRPDGRSVWVWHRAATSAVAGLVAAGALAGSISPVAAATPAALDPGLLATAQAGGNAQVAVIVREANPTSDTAERAVAAAGGRVTLELPLVKGFAAVVPAGSLAALGRSPAFVRIWSDATITPQGVDMSSYDKANPNAVFPQLLQSARTLAGGYDGSGVGVALIDTGVADVAGLGARVVERVDFTPDQDGIDHYGHGTHLAGIIAGDGTGAGMRAGLGSMSKDSAVLTTTLPQFSAADVGQQITVAGAGSNGAALVSTITGYTSPTTVTLAGKASVTFALKGWQITGLMTGVAPGANIISIKTAGWNGATDVSVIIGALQWAVTHKDAYNIKVLCLAFGTDSTQSAAIDPLNYAVEQAWFSGIFVVVSSGNSGLVGVTTNSLTKPGDDPYVLTVGAADMNGTLNFGDDTVPAFSSHGALNAKKVYTKPDILAPGMSLVSLLAPNSYVAKKHAAAILAMPSGMEAIKGTGTSQATAVVAGIAALMYQAYPTMTPDVAKATILSGATSVKNGLGQKEVNFLQAMKDSVGKAFATKPANVGLVPSTGLGSLEASRGSLHVMTDLDGSGTPQVVQGEVDVLGQPWDGRSWTGRSWTTGGWTGRSWTDYAWDSVDWAGRSWTGRSWTGMGWDAASWADATWDGRSWTDSQWDAASWASDSWGW